MSDVEVAVRVVGGGEPTPLEREAIERAVDQTLRARTGPPRMPTSAWALAGRLEGSGGMRIRGRSGMLDLRRR